MPDEPRPHHASRPTDIDEEARIVGADDEWHRRMRVHALRLRGRNIRHIARALKVDVETIYADIEWIRAHHKTAFALADGTFDPLLEIGEAVASIAEAETSAWRMFSALPSDKVRDKNACLRTAIYARLARLDVLQTNGILERNIGTLGLNLRADVIRDALQREGLLVTEMRQGVVVDTATEDPVDAWMRKGGYAQLQASEAAAPGPDGEAPQEPPKP